ncbi:MAG: translation initiation factor 2 [Eubacterium sp.]|nr:translation initiation factor 2 [Eubacterium sp.]
MKGKHRVIIEAERLKYEFEIKRNVTVVQGDSATGKTTLVDLIQTYGRYGQEAGIMVTSDVPCVAFSGDAGLWKTVLDAYRDSIIFFDEDYYFIFTTEFAEAIRNSSNYYVIITRQPLNYIPYSINEIYGIRTTGKYHFPEKVYHEFYPLFPEQVMNCTEKVVLLVEDKKSGYQFYQSLNDDVECISSEGNASIAMQLEKISKNKPVMVIADGAAFGAYVAKVMAVAKRRSNLGMYFPESFEWVILRSGVVDIRNLDDILAHPEEYIDSGVYFSWERYFTDLLESSTKDDRIRRYDKSKLNEYYLEGKNRVAILNVLPKELRGLLSGPMNVV